MDVRTGSVIVLVAAVFAGLIATSGARRGPAREGPPAVELAGPDSRVATARYVLIKDEDAWARVWSEHAGVERASGPPLRHAAPRIDFARFMVVGFFRGASVNEDGEIASSVLVGDDAVRVRYEPSSFQTASLGPGPDNGVTTRPFGLWVIDQCDKPVVVEEGRRELKNQPVKWVEVKRFEARASP